MKTIRLYHPHTHEGVDYDPPPEGIDLNVNDADAALLDAWGLTTPPPGIAQASAVSPPAADAPLAPRHDRRARVGLPADTEPTADATRTA